jgi:glucose/arabinose dehydrogenase
MGVVAERSLPTPPAAWRVAVDTIARGLEVPWGLAVTPDGRILVTERPGRIRVVDSTGLRAEPWATLDAFSSYRDWGPESGMMGIALAPDFATSREVFVVVTVWRTNADREGSRLMAAWRRVAGLVSPQAALIVKNRVVRFVERDGRGAEPTVIVDDLPAW